MHTAAITTTANRRTNDMYTTNEKLTLILLQHLALGEKVTISEPCVGEGHIARVLHEAGHVVHTNDIDKQYAAHTHLDATKPELWELLNGRIDWTITNPPYSDCAVIVANAYEASVVGIAMLLRLSFLEPTVKGVNARGEWLDAHKTNLRHMLIFNPRPSFTGDGNTDSVTAVWLVWEKAHTGGCIPQFIMDWK